MGTTRHSSRVRAIVLTLIVCAGFFHRAPAQQTPKAKKDGPAVLVLVSRSPSDTWAVAEASGITRVLGEATPPPGAVVEYLDWQGSSGPDYEERMTAYYATKFARRKFRVVVAADEPAVEFLIRRRAALFPNTQAVFCGLRSFDETRREPWFTGIFEANDPPATFDFARRLQPRLKRFVILEDSTQSGQGALRKIRDARPEAATEVSLELLRADTAQALFEGVEELPPDSAVLMTRARLARRVFEELRDRCPVPIYGLRAPMHLPGILGGVLLDGEQHGAEAGRIALRLLAGEKAGDIPFSPGVPYRVVADHGQMQRFGFPLSALPPGCEVLNIPPSVWQRHRRVLLGSGAVIVVLGALVLALLVLLRQKRAAAARLDRSLSVLSATFDSISDGVLVVSKAGKMTNCNGRFLELWKVPRDLAEKRDDSTLLQTVYGQLKDADAFLKRVQELYAHPEESSSDLIEFTDGRVFERDSRPQRQGGEIVGRVWSFRDATARRRAEEERLRLSGQLAQAQKMEALGTLAGGIAHDFNNMLTGILGCSQLALDRLPPTHPAADELRQVIEAGERASDLVRQILTFSRKRTPEKKVVSLESIVRDTLRLMRATAPAGIELAAELQPGVPPVLADPAQMHQAVLNLCTNAVHAMGRGPGELRVILARSDPTPELREAYPQLPAGPLVSLSVSDTGHGMDAATLARVFEPFYSTKATGEGTGLGLAVVHGIVQAHEGAIFAQSEPGHGTTFTLLFPPASAPIAEPTAITPAGSSIPRGHGESILVVDDEPIVCEVAATMLRRLGYQPVIAHAGERALELMQAEPGACALVFTDLNMPRMTGLDLIRRLREAGDRVPCLLTTGYIGSGATEAEARALGVSDIVEKPFTERTLGLAVSTALDGTLPA